MSTRRNLFGAGVAAGLAAGLLILVGPSRGHDHVPPRAAAADTLATSLDVTDVQAVMIAIDRRADGAARVQVSLGGLPRTLDLRPHSVRDPQFQLRVTGDDGRVRTEAPPPVRTFRGAVEGIPGSRVAAAIDGERMTAWIDTGAEVWAVQPLDRNAPGHVVYRDLDMMPRPEVCGLEEMVPWVGPAGAGGAAGGAAAGSGSTCAIALTQIAIDTDWPFFDQSGGTVADAVFDAESIMNAVDLIFVRDVGISYQITELMIRETPGADPYAGTSIFQLLGEFREMWNALHNDPKSPDYIERDVAHLFSGRPNRGVIGLAALGVVCHIDLAYAVSMVHWTPNFVLRVGVVAHELGHNWNALHCQSACQKDPPNLDCRIMCPCISGCNQDPARFGQGSIDQITAFRNSRTCLDDAAPVLPPLAKLLLEENGQLSGELTDQFGKSIALDGDTAMIGAWSNDEPEGTDVGGVFVYRFQNGSWTPDEKLLPVFDDPSNPTDDGLEAFDRFGAAAALDGERALFGAPTDDGLNNLTRSSGAVYAFERSGSSWQEEDLLRPTNPGGGDQFGTAVAVVEDGPNTAWAVIGAPFDDVVPVNSGSIYIFRYESGQWQQYQKIVPLDTGPLDEFGSSVAIAYDAALDRVIIAAGAPKKTVSGQSNEQDGAVYIFVPESIKPDALFAQEQKLTVTPSTGDVDQRFGSAVALDVDEELGASILVGARGADGFITDAGAAYVFRYDDVNGIWIIEAGLASLSASTGDDFGGAVALKGTRAVVGARLSDEAGANAGSATVFEGTLDEKSGFVVWQPSVMFTPVPGMPADWFGSSLAIDEVPGPGDPPQVFVGATGDQTQGLAAGAVYVFGLEEVIVDCNGNDVPDQCDILSGDSDDCNFNGVPDECEIAQNPGLDVSPMDGILDICQDCDGDGILDVDELANCDGSPGCQDCNANGLPDECDIASGTSEDADGDGVPDECGEDCNGNGIPDPAEIANCPGLPACSDCNGNGIPDECDITSGLEFDCNGNGVPDVCDIADGTSTDLDANGVPDECDPDCDEDGVSDFIEILFDLEQDCNSNGIPDSCDIRDSTSPDFNQNGIPDECECFPDFDGSGEVDILDLLGLLGAWGTSDPTYDIAPIPPDGIVNIQDLLGLLANWGSCP